MKQSNLLRMAIMVAMARIQSPVHTLMNPYRTMKAAPMNPTNGLISQGPISRANHGFKRNRRAELKRSARRTS